MKFKLLILVGFIGLFCIKDIMIQQGFTEIEDFEWKVNEAGNQLNLKYWLIESPVDTIKTVTVQIRVEGIDLENTYKNPTVKIDNDEKSFHKGEKCIEESWVPTMTITPTNIEDIRFFIK